MDVHHPDSSGGICTLPCHIWIHRLFKEEIHNPLRFFFFLCRYCFDYGCCIYMLPSIFDYCDCSPKMQWRYPATETIYLLQVKQTRENFFFLKKWRLSNDNHRKCKLTFLLGINKQGAPKWQLEIWKLWYLLDKMKPQGPEHLRYYKGALYSCCPSLGKGRSLLFQSWQRTDAYVKKESGLTISMERDAQDSREDTPNSMDKY